MSDNQSLGPIQVYAPTVHEINDALRQICERIDQLKGLRGRVLIYDRVRADTEAEAQDVVVATASTGTFVRLAGVSGGQTVYGDTAASGNLTLGSTSDSTKGNIVIQDGLDHNGTTVSFFGVGQATRASAYTPTNVTTDRSYDANATSTDELADVLGTLIADLQTYGLLQ